MMQINDLRNEPSCNSQHQFEVKSEVLDSDVISLIISYADFETSNAFLEVSKGAYKMVSILNTKRIKEEAFGKKEWFDFFGLNIGDEPEFPSHIIKILNSPCPMDPTKKVKDTHLFVVIPKNLTVKSFEVIARKYLDIDNYNSYRLVPSALETVNAASYWLLMSKDLFPGSRGQSSEKLLEMVNKFSQAVKVDYQIPTIFEAVVSILMRFIRTRERLFSDNPGTYTRCLDKIRHQVVVGGFGHSGLRVHDNGIYFCNFIGVAVVRRFNSC
jgi:hypothetical protein